MAQPTAPPPVFHMRHDAEEDRVLVLMDVGPDRHYAMALTRRLAKLLLAALADQRMRREAAAPDDPARREAVLTFEHEHAVAQSLASGETRRDLPPKPLVAPPRLIREIKLTPRPDGGVTMVLDDRNNALTIDLDPARLHSFMAGLLEMAAKAEWDLPRIAAWLEGAATSPATEAGPKVVH